MLFKCKCLAGFDLKSYRQCLQKWNAAITAMNEECKALGPKNCLPVIYEQLVLHPEQWMRKISNFLEVPWSDSVLHHEKQINQKGGISLSKVERSSDQVGIINTTKHTTALYNHFMAQVIKPVNLDALSKWVGHIPDDVVEDMASIAPMLAHFGEENKEHS